MTSIAHLFSPGNVLLDIAVAERRALFEAVAARWSSATGVDAGFVVDALQAREDLGSTGLGRGVAIPHARRSGATATLSAFVRPASAIEFDAPDGLPVDCFVFLLVPDSAIQEHLHLVGEIAQRLSDAAFRRLVRAARTPEEVNHLFASDPQRRQRGGQ